LKSNILNQILKRTKTHRVYKKNKNCNNFTK